MKTIKSYVVEKLVIGKSISKTYEKDKFVEIVKNAIYKVLENLNYQRKCAIIILCDKNNYVTDDVNQIGHISLSFHKSEINDEKEIRRIIDLIKKELPDSISSKVKEGRNSINQKLKYNFYL